MDFLRTGDKYAVGKDYIVIYKFEKEYVRSPSVKFRNIRDKKHLGRYNEM